MKVNWLERRDFLLGFLVVFSLFSVALNVLLILHITHPSYLRNLKISRLHPPPVSPADHVRGNPNAPVTIIEYSDFQCPFCRQMHVSLQSAANEGKIRWVYRDYPLTSIHRFAQREAEVAQCAGVQGKFWEYADALFAAQDEVTSSKASDQELIALAQGIQADPAALMQCVNSGRFRSVVSAEANEAEKLEISATPTIFINRERHEGLVSYVDLEKLLVKTTP